MEIKTEKPKCFDRLVQVFNIEEAWEKGLIITYGAQIHCKYGSIPPDLEVHELVHVRQQEGIDPDTWVERFIEDLDFRRDVEVEAFQAQAKYLRENIKDRNDLAKRLHFIHCSISSKLYGNMMTYSEANELI